MSNSRLAVKCIRLAARDDKNAVLVGGLCVDGQVDQNDVVTFFCLVNRVESPVTRSVAADRFSEVFCFCPVDRPAHSDFRQ